MKKHLLKLQPAYDFKNFILNIEKHFKEVSTNIHKARNELKILSHKNINCVVKSFKIPHLFNRVVYTYFRDSKAKKSYKNALRISAFTPAPIAYIEFFSSSLLEKSFFISEHFSYDFTIREPLLEENFPKREEIFRAFARFSLSLHNENISHKDYSPGNILIQKKGSEFIFKIVDINRMEFIPLNSSQRAKSFSKLWASEYILEIIADEYAKHYQTHQRFLEDVLAFSLTNKRVKNFKKRLKGKPVND